jgi:hypothetical protein
LAEKAAEQVDDDVEEDPVEVDQDAVGDDPEATAALMAGPEADTP